jgi:hypothetical protein
MPLSGRTGSRAVSPALLDPVLVGVVAFVVYALHGFHGVLDRDLGLFVYGGERFAQGVPPYHDVFNSVGPLAGMLPGVGILAGQLVGLGPVLSARLMYVVLAALCCSATCILARQTMGSRTAGLVAPAVFLLFVDFSHLASNGPREKTAMLLFSTTSLLLVQRRHFAAAGAFAALATLTWQPSLVVSLGAMVAATLLEQRGGRLVVLVRFVVGGTVVTAVTVLYFAAMGALSAAIDGFLLINLLDTHQASVLSRPAHIWMLLWDGYHVSIVLVLGGLVAMLALAVRALPHARAGRRPGAEVDDLSRRVVVAGAGTLGGLSWTILVINGAPDLFMLLPSAALGVSGVLLLLTRRWSTQTRTRVLLTVAGLAVIVAGTDSVLTRDETLVTERADVHAVLATQPRSAEVMSVDAPEVLALSRRRNPTSYQLFNRRMRTHLEHAWPGGVDAFVAEMAQRRPTFVVVSLRIHGGWLRPLLRHYHEVGTTMRWTWYLRTSAGPEALERARRANAAAMSGYHS